MPIKVFDFFSGCGGTSAGLRASGMDIVMGLDFDQDSSTTFQNNFPEAKFIHDDIRQVETERIKFTIESCGDHPILFSGCAPCQPFSVQNQKRNKKPDARIDLLAQFGRFVAYYLPDYVLVENVPGIQRKIQAESPLEKFTILLTNAGYTFEARVISSQDYGVPQKRARLVLIATKHGGIQLPIATHGPKTGHPYVTVWDAISHLPPLSAGEQHQNIPNHHCAALSELNLKRIRATPEGGDRRNWSADLMLKCHIKADAKKIGSGGHVDVYGRLRRNQPSAGLTTRCTSISNGRFGHPEQDRALSVREAACLQTFPENFIFFGKFGSTARQVGNAVPVLLAQKLGEQIVHHVQVHRIEVLGENNG